MTQTISRILKFSNWCRSSCNFCRISERFQWLEGAKVSRKKFLGRCSTPFWRERFSALLLKHCRMTPNETRKIGILQHLRLCNLCVVFERLWIQNIENFQRRLNSLASRSFDDIIAGFYRKKPEIDREMPKIYVFDILWLFWFCI